MISNINSAGQLRLFTSYEGFIIKKEKKTIVFVSYALFSKTVVDLSDICFIASCFYTSGIPKGWNCYRAIKAWPRGTSHPRKSILLANEPLMRQASSDTTHTHVVENVIKWVIDTQLTCDITRTYLISQNYCHALELINSSGILNVLNKTYGVVCSIDMKIIFVSKRFYSDFDRKENAKINFNARLVFTSNLGYGIYVASLAWLPSTKKPLTLYENELDLCNYYSFLPFKNNPILMDQLIGWVIFQRVENEKFIQFLKTIDFCNHAKITTLRNVCGNVELFNNKNGGIIVLNKKIIFVSAEVRGRKTLSKKEIWCNAELFFESPRGFTCYVATKQSRLEIPSTHIPILNYKGLLKIYPVLQYKENVNLMEDLIDWAILKKINNNEISLCLKSLGCIEKETLIAPPPPIVKLKYLQNWSGYMQTINPTNGVNVHNKKIIFFSSTVFSRPVEHFETGMKYSVAFCANGFYKSPTDYECYYATEAWIGKLGKKQNLSQQNLDSIYKVKTAVDDVSLMEDIINWVVFDKLNNDKVKAFLESIGYLEKPLEPVIPLIVLKPSNSKENKTNPVKVSASAYTVGVFTQEVSNKLDQYKTASESFEATHSKKDVQMKVLTTNTVEAFAQEVLNKLEQYNASSESLDQVSAIPTTSNGYQKYSEFDLKRVLKICGAPIYTRNQVERLITQAYTKEEVMNYVDSLYQPTTNTDLLPIF